MTKTPDISIIIPAFNVAEFISPCLDSIMRQDGIQDCEIIVVNDGSTDDTGKIIKEYSSDYSNIKLINQKNSGVSVARNNAMTHARGHFVSFVDADDIVGISYKDTLSYFVPNTKDLRLTKDKIRDNMRITFLYFHRWINMNDIEFQPDTQYFTRLINPLRDNGIDISFGGKVTFDAHGRGLLRHIYESDKIYTPTDKQEILHQADIRESANFALYRRKFLADKKLTFLPQMDLDEDMLFTQQAVLRATNVATVTDATYLYYRRPGTLSNMDMHGLGREHKFNLARVQRYSMLINELRGHPEYATLYSAFIKEFSDPKHKMLFYTDSVPPDECGNCNSITCKECKMRPANDALIERNILDFIINQR